jgi:Pro-kumamolisin, activation domain
MLILGVFLVSTFGIWLEANSSLKDDENIYFELGRPDPWSLHEVVFCIQQNNFDLIEERLKQVSDPLSDLYGKYYDREQIVEITANPSGTEAVISFLVTNGIQATLTTPFGEYITVVASISLLENMLKANFVKIKSALTHEIIIRAKEYTIPEPIQKYVISIIHVSDLPPLTTTIEKEVTISKELELTKYYVNRNSYITPKSIIEHYHINGSHIDKGSAEKSTQCLFETNNEYFSKHDVYDFQHFFRIPKTKIITDEERRETEDLTCVDYSLQCMDSNVILEYSTAIAPGSKTAFW